MNYHEIYTAETLQNMATEVNGWDDSLEHLEYHEMERFNELLHDMEPEQIALKVHFGDFNPTDEFFNFDGYANLISYRVADVEDEISDNAFEIVERYEELTAEGVVDGDLLADTVNEMEGE